MATIIKRVKDAVSRYLERLAKENQKSFGGGKLDCCRLNQERSNKK